MECVKSRVGGVGFDNMDESQLCEFEKWTCIAKNIAEYDYYYNIVKAMKESGAEYGEDYDYRGKYYTNMLDSKGRFMRRGYEEPMRYDWDRDMSNNSDSRYKDWEHGKHYYTEPTTKVELMENVDHFKKNVDDMMADMTQAEREELKMKLKSIFNTL